VESPLDFLGHIKHTTDFLTSVKGDYTDALVLYVTGLTPVLTSFLQVWDWTQNLIEDEGGNPSQLILMHYDRDSGSYVPQHY
jgi:phosphatidate phosphatase PAH1